MPVILDERLKEHATPRQWEIMEAHARLGTMAAANELETDSRYIRRTIKKVKDRAAKRGYSPDHDMIHAVPAGFMANGVSTHYVDGELRSQWVKSKIDTDWQDELFRAAIEGLTETIKPAKPIKAPGQTLENLMVCYPVGDHHFGMLAHHEENNQADYDLKIGEALLIGAMDHLVDITKGCGRAAIILLGDFFHHDGQGVTPTSGNVLDVDGRASKMVRAAMKCARYMIDAALRHHGAVDVVIEIGNHDLYSSIFLMEALAAVYEKEPRVSIDTSPAHYHYLTHGACLIGTHHGHGAKMEQLPLIMAADRPKEWGETKYRYWYTGHIHNKKGLQMAVTEEGGCLAESFRILPPSDAWAANKGYRAGRDMKAIVLHKQFGEVARHTVNPAMLGAA